MELSELRLQISSRFGAVKRARSCFLYTKKGIRLTDLYQENGRAILGWGGSSAFTMLKNVLSRGLTGSFDTEFLPQLNKAVSQLLCSTRLTAIFSNKQEALEFALKISYSSTSVWKPWNQENIDYTNVDSVVLEPPLPWTPTIFIVAIKNTEKNAKEILNAKQIFLPAVLTVAITRSIYNLIKALQERQEKDWFIYDKVLTKYWTRKGPYLFPKIQEKNYDNFVKHCLDQEIVINPNYNSASIVPFGADIGVFGKLKNAPFDF